MVNNVHKPPDSYLTQIMYGNVFAFFYHTLPYHGMFKDTLLGYLWQHNARIGIPASRHPLSYSVSRSPLDFALVYIFHCRIFVKLYPAIRDIEWHRGISFLLSWPSCDPEALEEKKRMRRESAKKVAELQAFVGLG